MWVYLCTALLFFLLLNTEELHFILFPLLFKRVFGLRRNPSPKFGGTRWYPAHCCGNFVVALYCIMEKGWHGVRDTDILKKILIIWKIHGSFQEHNIWWLLINYNNNNNNNKAFKSQTSWGRLELKPSRSNQGSGTWIAVFQALLSKAKSLGIFYPFKSHFIASTQVNFGLPLPLFTLLSWLRIPLLTLDEFIVSIDFVL